jgi:hypothetical protein
LKILKEFLYGFDFLRMTPNETVLRSVSPDLSARALVDRGRAYAIYLHVPLPKKPKKLGDHLRQSVRATLVLDAPRGAYRAEWIDTKTGETTASETFRHRGGAKELHSPPFDNDVALRVMLRQPLSHGLDE